MHGISLTKGIEKDIFREALDTIEETKKNQKTLASLLFQSNRYRKDMSPLSRRMSQVVQDIQIANSHKFYKDANFSNMAACNLAWITLGTMKKNIVLGQELEVMTIQTSGIRVNGYGVSYGDYEVPIHLTKHAAHRFIQRSGAQNGKQATHLLKKALTTIVAEYGVHASYNHEPLNYALPALLDGKGLWIVTLHGNEITIDTFISSHLRELDPQWQSLETELNQLFGQQPEAYWNISAVMADLRASCYQKYRADNPGKELDSEAARDEFYQTFFSIPWHRNGRKQLTFWRERIADFGYRFADVFNRYPDLFTDREKKRELYRKKADEFNAARKQKDQESAKDQESGKDQTEQ